MYLFTNNWMRAEPLALVLVAIISTAAQPVQAAAQDAGTAATQRTGALAREQASARTGSGSPDADARASRGWPAYKVGYDSIQDSSLTQINRSNVKDPPSPYLQAYSLAEIARLQDRDGYPGINPPWGTLNAINLKTGEFACASRR